MTNSFTHMMINKCVTKTLKIIMNNFYIKLLHHSIWIERVGLWRRWTVSHEKKEKNFMLNIHSSIQF